MHQTGFSPLGSSDVLVSDLDAQDDAWQISPNLIVEGISVGHAHGKADCCYCLVSLVVIGGESQKNS